MLRIFSFGGGVQSTACLVLAAQGKIDFPIMTNKPKHIVCADCAKKYPKIVAGRELDAEALAKYDCEVHEGDTDPALWGYGTQAQIDDARYFARDR